MYVFSGSASDKLADSLAKRLKGKRGEVERTYFANGEMRIQVVSKRVGSTAIVVQSLVAPVEEHLVEFSFLCDALHRMGVVHIVAILPWLGYSKQDKVFRPGEALSIKVVAKMLQVVPIKQFFTLDLHNLAILGFFDVPVTNISARSLFFEYFKRHSTNNTVVVAPDAGAVKSSTSFAVELDLPVVYIDKKRDLTSGKVAIAGISGSVKGKNIITVDDMIVTGSTLIEVATFLKSRGASRISVAATHHLYVKGAQEAIEKSGVDEIVVTDTILPRVRSKSLIVLPVAPLLAQALENTD